jgi:Cof subfamily protein (haloacid dehalogenase superfamily)
VKELLVFDMDGTLVAPDDEITPLTRKVLAMLDARGIDWTIATGRMPHGVPLGARDTLAGLTLRHPQAYKNGVLIWDLNHDVRLNTIALEGEALLEVCRRLEDGGINFWLNTLDHDDRIGAVIQRLTNDREKRWVEAMAEQDIEVKLHSDFARLSGHVLNVSAVTDRTRALAMAEGLADLPGIEVFAGPALYEEDHYWLDIHHVSGTKGDAVKFLQRHIGAERLVCFGDSDNDISMFHCADECYAMGNALPELKALATDVIGSNAEDGIARFLIERYGL